MSLTRSVKSELARPGADSNCCDPWELKALIARLGVISGPAKAEKLQVGVDYVVVARRLYTLLGGAGAETTQIVKQKSASAKRNYLVQVNGREQVESLLVYLDLRQSGGKLSLSGSLASLPKRACCRKSFLRGLFLASGSISASSKSGYHLEISCGSPEDARAVIGLFNLFLLVPRVRKRKESAFIYFKNAETIADYLRVIGASKTLLDLESKRVVKSMRNQVNRLVNCESANLEKVVSSAQMQLDLINRAAALIGLENLTPALREVAFLRIEHPEASLKELGEMLEPPVGKSGINHRFRQLAKAVDSKQAD